VKEGKKALNRKAEDVLYLFLLSNIAEICGEVLIQMIYHDATPMMSSLRN